MLGKVPPAPGRKVVSRLQHRSHASRRAGAALLGCTPGPRARHKNNPLRAAPGARSGDTGMTTDAKAFPGELRWENDGISRIPFKTYTDEALDRK